MLNEIYEHVNNIENDITITWISSYLEIKGKELRKTAITSLRYGKRTETGMAMYLLHRLTVVSAI